MRPLLNKDQNIGGSKGYNLSERQHIVALPVNGWVELGNGVLSISSTTTTQM